MTTEIIETTVIAGQTWTVDREFTNVILLTSERGTVRMARAEGHTRMWAVPNGRYHAHRGNVVRLLVTTSTVEQIS